MKPYNELGCCDQTLGVDNLLKRYSEDRKKIYKLMIKDVDTLIGNIWSNDSILSIDNKCLCQVGKKPLATYICSQCHNLKRLIDFGSQGVNEIFEIECGKKEGAKMMVKNYDVKNPGIFVDNFALKKSKEYLNKHSSLLVCGTPEFDNVICYSGDYFTISSLISIYLQEHFSKMNLYHIAPVHSSFICHYKGYQICELPDIGKFFDLVKNKKYLSGGKLEKSVLRGIILQLLVIYNELSKLYFSHGNPTLNSLLFSSKPCKYVYEGIEINCPVTVMLDDFYHSSLTVKDKNHSRFFSKSAEDEINIKKSSFSPNIKIIETEIMYSTEKGTKEFGGNFNFYKLEGDTFEIFNTMRHLGLPFFTSSYDFYMIILSLYLRPEVDMSSDSLLQNIWSLLWLKEDLDQLPNLINEYNGDTFNIIKNMWLKCSPLDPVFDYLKN